MFDGTDVKTTTINGIRADISTTKPPALCGADTSDSSIWVALATADYVANPCSLAQSGYGIHEGQNTIFVFAQYGVGNCNMVPPIIVVEAPQGNHTYEVGYIRRANVAKRKATMWYDGHRIAKTNFDPEAKWGGQPWAYRYAAEVHDYGDDTMGTPDVQAFFTNIRIRECKGCGFFIPTGLGLDSDSDRQKWKWDDADTFRVWTE
ncbi:MAG: hypothetical protein HY741_04585 [Chloroflexi bacterium]|nr:hypothetical protein [Chloroflexota bacterium]